METSSKLTSPEILIHLATIDAKICGLQKEIDGLRALKSKLALVQMKMHIDIPNAPIKLYDDDEIKSQLIFHNYECRNDLEISANHVIFEYGGYRRHITITLPFSAATEIKDHGFIYFDGENCPVELNLTNISIAEQDVGHSSDFFDYLIENYYVDPAKIAAFMEKLPNGAYATTSTQEQMNRL